MEQKKKTKTQLKVIRIMTAAQMQWRKQTNGPHPEQPLTTNANNLKVYQKPKQIVLN